MSVPSIILGDLIKDLSFVYQGRSFPFKDNTWSKSFLCVWNRISLIFTRTSFQERTSWVLLLNVNDDTFLFLYGPVIVFWVCWVGRWIAFTTRIVSGFCFFAPYSFTKWFASSIETANLSFSTIAMSASGRLGNGGSNIWRRACGKASSIARCFCESFKYVSASFFAFPERISSFDRKASRDNSMSSISSSKRSITLKHFSENAPPVWE